MGRILSTLGKAPRKKAEEQAISQAIDRLFTWKVGGMGTMLPTVAATLWAGVKGTPCSLLPFAALSAFALSVGALVTLLVTIDAVKGRGRKEDQPAVEPQWEREKGKISPPPR